MQQRRTFLRRCGAVVLVAGGGIVAGSLAGCTGGRDDAFSNLPTTTGSSTRLVQGAQQQVAGAGTVATWARVDRNDVVMEVGATIPLALAQNMSNLQPGTGPAGALVSLPFPAQVRSSTFFNHFQVQAEPEGHPPFPRYGAAHFDLHFYAVPEEQVRQVTAPDLTPPAPERVPAGYTYPGVEQAVPEMGVHALANAEFAPGAAPFSATMVLGYYRGQMTFLEPMVTQALLLQRQSFTLPVPRPAVLGRSTRYPTRFTATFVPESNTYQFVFSDFVAVTQ
jgi:hypothetical protein